MNGRFSLRTRLLLAVGAITMLTLSIADVAIYTSLKSYLYGQVDSTLQLSHRAIEAAASSGDSQDGPGVGELGLPDVLPGRAQLPGASNFCEFGRESAPGMYIEVRTAQNKTASGELCPAFAPGKSAYSPKLPAVITGFARNLSDPNEPSVYLTVSSTSKDGPLFRVRASELQNGAILIVADPISNISNTLGQLLLLEVFVTAGALVGAVILGLWLVRIGLRPLRDVVRTAEVIAEGDLMHRVPNANMRTEVGHVATALNVMLERIQESFRDLQASEDRLRRFVSDASHELRTPISAVSAYAQLFQQGARERAEDLPRVMDGIERETRRMTRLVEDLLLLTRFDEDQTLDRQPVELVGLVVEAVETARTVGPGWPIDFRADEPIEVMGDWGALRQVIDNLLANVRAHTPIGTMSTVQVGRIGDEAFVEVKDDGPGISDEQAELVFERFFRSDPSRSRETGGAGLGLAIVATIVRAHGGRVVAERGVSGGAVFRVLLPVLDSAEREVE
jgi:signal transduction histidine kinase